ncbi:MAG: hypothetical protein IKX20_07795 [Paludibacteraceae bacterium]|nr:hypothetical protein [Paludibacteraceae bacterium]
MNIFQMMSLFQQNPLSLLQKRFNIPNGINNPQDILNHLIQSGQVTQDQVNQAQQMGQNFRQFMK